MSEEEFNIFLYEALNAYVEEKMVEDEIDSNVAITTFEEAGLLTYTKGVVVSMGTDEFQISVVRSR